VSINRASRIGLSRRTLLAGAGLSLAAPAVHAQAAAGVALVIGNSKYQWEAQLPNVRRDAPDIARQFQSMGLKTELVQDVGRDGMRQAIDAFKASARGARFAGFYFAGHGANWAKDTYVVPVDADLSNPNAVDKQVAVTAIQEATAGAANRLMVFDNCRNNPADGWRQLEAQRAAAINLEVQQRSGRTPPPNTLALYSTSPGRIALDGPPGQNSPFAAALLRELSGPSVDLQALPAKLRRQLLMSTQGRQVLWDTNSYQQPFVLKGAPAQAAAAGAGWSSDPSRLVELSKAYAYAQENGLPLPAGLVSHRLATASRDGQKIGSFKYTGKGERGLYPGLIIVLSVEEKQTAELIMAGNRVGPFWRFVTGSLSGDNLEYQARDQGGHFTFTWKSAEGGTLTTSSAQKQTGGGGGSSGFYSSPFTRLDG